MRIKFGVLFQKYLVPNRRSIWKNPSLIMQPYKHPTILISATGVVWREEWFRAEWSEALPRKTNKSKSLGSFPVQVLIGYLIIA